MNGQNFSIGELLAIRAMPPTDLMRAFGNARMYVYYAEFPLAGAFGTTTQDVQVTINITSDANFLWQSGFATDSAASTQQFTIQSLPNAGIQILDQGSGRQLSNAFVPISNMFGPFGAPFILPQQRLFLRNTNVTITMRNYASAAQTTPTRISLIGTKINLLG